MKKILFAAMAATVLFASCAKEENGNVTEGADTYAGISISFPKMTTSRAVISDTNATAAEQAVTTVGVYVVDVNSGTMHSKVYSSTEFEEGTGNFYVLKTALKTTTGTKNVYVVLNPTTTVSNEIAAKRGVVFGTASIAATEAAFINLPTDMVMSGASAATVALGVVEAAAALADPVAITVQRNTAKVAVTYNSSVSGGIFTFTNGTATVTDFAPITTAKNSYLIQQLANSANPISVANVRTPGYSVTPAATNPYWATLAAPAPAAYKTILASTTANTALNAFYALENVNQSNVEGNTTAAIIKATIAPAAGTVVLTYNIADGTMTTGNYTAGQDFYVKKSDNTVWSADAYTAAIVSGSPMSLTADHFSKPYVSGVSYYRIWVQDADGTIGVLRNNYYVMQINSISGFGSPTVPGVDPEDPTEPEDPTKPIDKPTYISVSVSVANWEVETSGHDL